MVGFENWSTPLLGIHHYIPSHPQSLFANLTNLSLSVYPQWSPMIFQSHGSEENCSCWAPGPCRPGYSSWSPPPTSRRTDGDKCRASWQWGSSTGGSHDYWWYWIQCDPILPDLLILYPVLVTVIIHRVRNDTGTSCYFWGFICFSLDISSFSPEIPEDASTRQFLEHHRSLRPRADGVQDLFEGLQQVGVGMGKTAWKSWVSPQKVEDGSGRYWKLACDCKFNWSNSVKWDQCAE